MIIDCFMFYNELQMLYYRLHLLGDIVDYFVVVESSYTHSGHPKPLYFDLYKHHFPFQNKIIHIKLDKLPFLSSPRNSQIWLNENYQRNMIKKGLQTLDLQDNDIIIISDIDEIPNPSIIKGIQINSIHSLSQDFYYYNLNNKINNKWDKAKILPYIQYKNQFNCKPQLCRNYFPCPIIDNAGWHLSYFGDSHFIVNKLKNFAHQELNNDRTTNVSFIQSCIDNSTDFKDPNISFSNDNSKFLPPSFHFFDNSKHLFIL